MIQKTKEFQKYCQQLQNASHVDFPQKELLSFLRYLRNIPHNAFVEMDPVSVEEEKHLNDFVKRRLYHEPFSKITGEKEFYSLSFQTSLHTLDPRPDSEHIIDTILKYYDVENAYHFLELGVGTGCLSITLLKQFINARCDGVDICEKALKTAIQNAKNHNVLDRASFYKSSWFDGVKPYQYDWIVSNPPYIAVDEDLDPGVLNFDPYVALFGGDDGLDAYRWILSYARPFLKTNGKIILEIGHLQKESVSEIAHRYSFKVLETIQDYGGRDRVLVLAP